ncbi:alpha/beta-type small acid-soluble spore protein [Paenibacillus sp. JX-17]|uniref:Alpha/beta-type small acid-soluble spore protein n=1 Tax=Paenibacillus lacisoli TaxID=3064525 RepID=A0ABT9CBD5_9BACL|nr:alpha/beta-type small acid-soluble spore protein [Paenibacillus sp. JX-17]MDO7906547.1 alpha/beta-type small acid-soluble spore protein [Paenibacillus sp. JX-17]
MARNNSRSNRKLVPESREMLNQMKYEIAAEFGYTSGGYGADTEFAGELGQVGQGSSGLGAYRTSRENGSVGGEMTKRLIAQAEKAFLS